MGVTKKRRFEEETIVVRQPVDNNRSTSENARTGREQLKEIDVRIECISIHSYLYHVTCSTIGLDRGGSACIVAQHSGTGLSQPIRSLTPGRSLTPTRTTICAIPVLPLRICKLSYKPHPSLLQQCIYMKSSPI